MKTKLEKYEKLKEKVAEFIANFEKETNSDSEILTYLKGWIISYSNIIEDCKILLIGINPGNGKQMDSFYFYDNNEEMPMLEYLNEEENKYGLARGISQIFEDANCKDIFYNNTMKTNTKFYATINKVDLDCLENCLFQKHNKLYQKLRVKTIEWTKIFIEEIAQPKLVIAEGISAYDFLYNDIYPKVRYVDLTERESIVPAWKNSENEMLFIGFRRDPWGNIPNFDAVSNEISKYLKTI